MTVEWLSRLIAVHSARAGALEDHVATFATVLAHRGYAEATAREHIRLVAEFGRWFDRKEVLLVELDEGLVNKFLALRRRRGRATRSHGTALRLLLGALRDASVTRPRRTVNAQSHPILDVERAFIRHLEAERGLHASTRDRYASVVRRLLSERRSPLKLGELRAEDVCRFVVRQAQTRPRCMPVIVPALRVFLRWLHQRGDTKNSLTGCVPAVAAWKLVTLPKSLPSDQVERLLQSCDRSTAIGRRDYAILLLLVRLGLRAGEVVAMDLGDLDWETGELIVRGKGGRQDRLPLPRDVGAAVAAYLRRGRPRCSTRRVFIRGRAPHRAFVSSVAVSNIVERGLERAGLEPPRKGAHTLRHALACNMLRRGASIAEIGQILRHRSPDTTAIYAKVDITALRSLAPAWPHSAGDA
jgi:site-specific recombinase XerD